MKVTVQNVWYRLRFQALIMAIQNLFKSSIKRYQKPSGAFYIVAKLPVKNADHFTKWLLSDFDVNGETVMPCPAEGFYQTPSLGVDEIRLAYVLNSKDLAKAATLLKEGLETYLKLNKE